MPVDAENLVRSFTECAELVQPPIKTSTAENARLCLQLETQNHIRVVLSSLLEKHYGLDLSAQHPPVKFATSEPKDNMLITLLVPNEQASRQREVRDVFVSLLRDLSYTGDHLNILGGPLEGTDILGFQYDAGDMRTALSVLCRSFLPENKSVEKSLNMIGHLVERLGDDRYIPAHRLH